MGASPLDDDSGATVTTVAVTTTTATEIHDGSLALIRVRNSGGKDIQIIGGTVISPGSYAEITTSSNPVSAKLVRAGTAGEVTVTDITPVDPTEAPSIPAPTEGDAGKALVVNEAEDGYELGEAGGTLLASPTTGDAGKFVAVNEAETGYELVAAPTGGGGAQSYLSVHHEISASLADGTDHYPTVIVDGSEGTDITLDVDGNTIHLAIAGIYDLFVSGRITAASAGGKLDGWVDGVDGAQWAAYAVPTSFRFNFVLHGEVRLAGETLAWNPQLTGGGNWQVTTDRFLVRRVADLPA